MFMIYNISDKKIKYILIILIILFSVGWFHGRYNTTPSKVEIHCDRVNEDKKYYPSSFELDGRYIVATISDKEIVRLSTQRCKVRYKNKWQK